jgi:hypothetical protein
LLLQDGDDLKLQPIAITQLGERLLAGVARLRAEVQLIIEPAVPCINAIEVLATLARMMAGADMDIVPR